uniref:Uncharacterized protein n=1 Tax=Glossina austeni TaxID=7395 RepID=A0A1A9UYX1_GLOAU
MIPRATMMTTIGGKRKLPDVDIAARRTKPCKLVRSELPPVLRCVKIDSASSFYLWRFIAKRRSRSLLVRFGDDGVQRQTAPVPQFAPHISFMKLWSRFCNNVFLNIVTASKCSLTVDRMVGFIRFEIIPRWQLDREDRKCLIAIF